MKRPLFILLCAAAALAGWGGMAWWRGISPAPAGKPATLSPAGGAAAPGDSARPAGKLPPGNPGLATLAAAIAQARALDPADRGTENRPGPRSKLDALPPGVARDLALALFDLRVLTASGAADAGPGGGAPNLFADLPAGTEPPVPWAEELRSRLLAGKGSKDSIHYDDPFASPGDPFADINFTGEQITRWASLDPAAASETILKMPPGESRAAAVDAAAKVMARDNPQAAWDMVVKSGEQKLGDGAARAWLAMLKIYDASQPDFPSAAAGLSPAQQAKLAQAVAGLLEPNALGQEQYIDPQELWMLTREVPALTASPQQVALLGMLAERDPRGLLFATGGRDYIVPQHHPTHALACARLLEEQAQADPAEVVAELKATRHDCPSLAAIPAVFNAAAPRLLPQLAKAGYVKEVAPLLGRIPDPQQQRAALESILPQWMDADPAAARAAFNAAPFTALERERWQRHPAFLLNPAER